MPVPVRQMPLMGQERRALHEKHRKRRHADIGHEVLDVFPAPLVRQTRTGRPQRRYKVLDRPHMVLESDSSPPANCPNPPRFNLSHPLNFALSAQNENCCCGVESLDVSGTAFRYRKLSSTSILFARCDRRHLNTRNRQESPGIVFRKMKNARHPRITGSAFIPFAVFRFAGGAIFVFVITCDAERSLFPRAGLDASVSAQAS
jgi:hypothetical protein